MCRIGKIIFCFFLFFIFSNYSKAQSDSLGGKYHYVICAESKSNVEAGEVLETNFKSFDEEDGLSFITGKIVDQKKEGIPFATVLLKTPGGKTITCQTDLDGKYKFPDLANGNYTISVIQFGYQPFTMESILIEQGESQEIIIDLGEYFCLKTKVISTDVQLKAGEFKPQ